MQSNLARLLALSALIPALAVLTAGAQETVTEEQAVGD